MSSAESRLKPLRWNTSGEEPPPSATRCRASTTITRSGLDLALDRALGVTRTVRGAPVMVMPPDHAWAAQHSVSVDELREERFVAMRRAT